MNKILIKVIKRKEAEVMRNVELESVCEPKPAATLSKEKIERNLHRKIVDTVSNWISERRENNRIEDSSAIRKMFGDESLLSKIA